MSLLPSPRDAWAAPADEPWLRKLTGKHKTAFDVEAHKNGAALGQAKNLLDAWKAEYRVEPPAVNLVMAVRGTGIPIVLVDALWARYRLGEHYGITDPATNQPAIRNPFIAANVQTPGLVTADQTVEALQARGVTFLVCRNTIAGATRKLTTAGLGPAADIRASLEGGILPNVTMVPAMVVAFTQMQERGVAYVFAG
ncbi:MAG: hypothetical protein ACXW05_19465 [Gemmatirosa sp.]